MTDSSKSLDSPAVPLLYRIAPGLAALMAYRREWLRDDLVAGMSVAAVALPTAIAYAQLAGFPPVVGLYASILPLVAYALFGTSRQLMVNPDAATCAMVAAIVAPLAAGDAALYVSLSVALAVFSGIFCIVAGFFRLGFLADFLARPILVGFLNGIAISIFLGQIGKVFGFPIESGGIVPRIVEFAMKLPQTHPATLAVGAVTVVALYGMRHFLPRLPAPLVAVVVAILLVQALGLDAHGVAIVGAVPAGLPELRIPRFPAEHLDDLLGSAVGLALVSFSSGMVTARSFAARNRYEIDVDKEFVALGACQISAGLSQGFAVTGADSRTAIGDVAGGKSQVTGLVAAAVMAVVLLFLTGPLQYLPIAALGAVLITAALGLFDWKALVRLWHISRRELLVCVVTMLGVVVLGVLQGILVAIGLAILLLLIRASRPPDAVLGRVAGLKGFHDVSAHEGAERVSGLVLYRFGVGVVFFNAPHFRKRVMQVVARNPRTRWFVVDASSINTLDSTGADIMTGLADELAALGVRFCIAHPNAQVRAMMASSGLLEKMGADAVFQTLKSSVKAFRAAHPEAEPPGE